MIYDMDIMCQSKLFSTYILALSFFFYKVADKGNSVTVEDANVVYSVYTQSWP